MMTKSPSSIDAGQVRHIARLAHIRLSEDEIAALTGDLARILHWANHLNEADLETVAPWQGAGRMDLAAQAPREAKPQDREKILANAPTQRDGHFSVPRFVE